MTQSGPVGLGMAIGLAAVLTPHVKANHQSTPQQREGETRDSTETAPASRRRTAEDLLRAFRRSRPLHDLVPPASVTPGNGVRVPHTLLPEGTPVFDRPGFVRQDGDWWTFVPDPDDGEPAMKLLPNANLEIMIRTNTGKSEPVRFSISGEVTAFEGENFLLIRLIRRTVASRNVSGAVPGESEKDGSARVDAAPNLSPEAPPPDPEDIIAMLQGQEPQAVVRHTPPDVVASFGQHPPPSNLRPDGSTLGQRPGRVAREQQWWIFVFESGHPEHPEATMKLLPGRGLELMLQSTRDIRSGLVLLVSGEVTQFGNENFLLPRGVIRKTDSGNLRK